MYIQYVEIFEHITGHLSKMLLSPFQEEWERNYKHARKTLSSDPAKVASLDKIYNKPQYYAGYHIATLPRNIGVNSSTPAEQNHSSVYTAFKGTTIMAMHDQVKIHFDRQQHQIRERQAKSNDWTVKQSYKPTNCDPPYSVIENCGRKVLDRVPFHQYLLKQIRSAKFLTKEPMDNGVVLYPSDQTVDTAKIQGQAYTITHGSRCPCYWRVSYAGQCSHELFNDQKFVAEKWDQRWYNNKYYRTVVPTSWNRTPIVGGPAAGHDNGPDV
jgi:hypothetical protein